MKKTWMALVATMLLLPFGASAAEEPQTLNIGDYESAQDGTGVYAGSYNEMAPTTFYMTHTGSQILYTTEDLAQLAGKNITSLTYVFYHMGSYDEITRNIRLYVQGVDATEFAKNEKGKYQFFDFSTDSLVASTEFYEQFGIEDDYMNHELKFDFSQPYFYDGQHSLLVTITFDGDGTTDGSDYAAFYSAGNSYKGSAMTFCSDNNTFADFLETDDWPTATSSTGTNLELPLTQFTYTTPETPAEPEEKDGVLSLGNYDDLLDNGTDADWYQGSYYDHCPTTFYLKHTGTQIIYTADQLTDMAGKAIKEVRFPFQNVGGYYSYPRTVSLWVEEIEGDAFERDQQQSSYMFFDYSNATQAINGYELEGDFTEYIGVNGELVLTFDTPVNYSGTKNLLLTITFDGDDCMDSAFDFDFFCNTDVKNRAMTYTDDSYSFAEFGETEDWPYATDGTGTKLEQPVTRFVYSKAVSTAIQGATATKATSNGRTYNLAGQRVASDAKGIVILNGKKLLKK